MRPSLLLSFALVLCPASGLLASDAPRASAIDAFVSGQLDRSESLARDWLKGHPRDGEIVRLLGMVRLTQGMQLEGRGERREDFLPVYREALEHLLAAEAARPDTRLPDLDHAVGYIRLAQGRFAAAEQRLGRAIELTPGNPVLRRLRGSARLGLGRYAEAVSDLEEASQGSPQDFATHMFLSQALFLAGREQDARSALEAYHARIESGPADERQWRTLYEIYRYAARANDLPAARSALERAVAARPEAAASRVDLAILEYEAGNFDLARSHLEALPDLDELPPGIQADALYYSGRLLRLSGDPVAARARFDDVLALQPSRAEALQALAEVSRVLGDGARAHELMQRYAAVVELHDAASDLESQLTVDPLDAVARVRLIGLLIDLGRRDEASRHLDSLQRHAPDSPELERLGQRLDATS